jgi:transposase
MLDRSRFVVSDAAWEKVAPLLPGKATDPGATGKDNRLFLEAVLWRVRTGVPWRDLPGEFGKGNSVFQRFRRWAKAGVFERVFAHLSGDPDFECALIDGTIVPVHQKASGAKGGLSLRPSVARAAG